MMEKNGMNMSYIKKNKKIKLFIKDIIQKDKEGFSNKLEIIIICDVSLQQIRCIQY
jgi:hypothetical protein